VKWLPGRRRAAPPADRRPEPEPEVHRSLALAALFGSIQPEDRLHVLDLGPAVGSNVESLSQRFVCKLQIGDLYRTLTADQRRFHDPEADPRALIDDALPRHGEPYDLVLAWDLLNYLTRLQIRALATLLGERCRPGARLFAMVATLAEMPAGPLTYLFTGEADLIYRDRPPHNRPGPRYRPAEISALTPGFAVDRSYLLRHGIQEYLLVRQSS
jgi:hypothetical protein